MTARNVTIIDDDESDKPIFCGLCEKLGIRSKYGPKILMPGEVRQEDYEDWLECPTCRIVVPIYNQIQSQFLEAFAELTDNPFDDQKGQIYGVPSPTSKEGRYQSAKRKRERNRAHHPDKEIDVLLRKYGSTNVTIHNDGMNC